MSEPQLFKSLAESSFLESSTYKVSKHMKINYNVLRSTCIALTIVLLPGQAIAAQCIATAKKDIQASEDNGEKRECIQDTDIKGKPIELCPSVFPQGESRPVSQKYINSATGINTICFKGDYCYPESGFTLKGKCSSPNIAIYSE